MLFLLTIYIFKILCIFLFVVYSINIFLMAMIIAKSEILQPEYPIEMHENVDDKLNMLSEKLTEKEQALQRSHCEIKNAEKVLTDLENKTSSYRDRYRSLMSELKKDVQKIENEVKTLQSHISTLSLRRESLKAEVIKQQEDYQKMLNNFTKELKHKKTLFSSGADKSKKSRLSCLSLQ
nr:uncharacterized protein LOC116425685 isoform X2 [Nomia melanderi]